MVLHALLVTGTVREDRLAATCQSLASETAASHMCLATQPAGFEQRTLRLIG